MRTMTEVLKCPRWVDAEGILTSVGETYNVQVTIASVSKILFTKYLILTIKGEDEDILEWVNALERIWVK